MLRLAHRHLRVGTVQAPECPASASNSAGREEQMPRWQDHGTGECISHSGLRIPQESGQCSGPKKPLLSLGKARCGGEAAPAHVKQPRTWLRKRRETVVWFLQSTRTQAAQALYAQTGTPLAHIEHMVHLVVQPAGFFHPLAEQSRDAEEKSAQSKAANRSACVTFLLFPPPPDCQAGNDRDDAQTKRRVWLLCCALLLRSSRVSPLVL
jgi:hypothetical protein